MRQRSAQLLAIGLTLMLTPSPGLAERSKAIPAAPVPTAIANAKTIFLSNGRGSSIAFDAFYAAVKEWGKYQIVGSPEEADLIVEIAYRVGDLGTRVWSASNTYDHTTHVYSRRMVDPQLILTIYDARTKSQLWAQTDHRRLARLNKNREKETVNSAQRLVDDREVASLFRSEARTASAQHVRRRSTHSDATPPARTRTRRFGAILSRVSSRTSTAPMGVAR